MHFKIKIPAFCPGRLFIFNRVRIFNPRNIFVIFRRLEVFIETPATGWIFTTKILGALFEVENTLFNPYPTAFPYGNGMVLHFYQQQESSTTKTVHKVINKGLKTYV